MIFLCANHRKCLLLLTSFLRKQCVNKLFELSSQRVFSLKHSADGSIWMTTNGGVGRYNGARIVNYDLTRLDADKGILFFGTRQGIKSLQTKQINTIDIFRFVGHRLQNKK